MESLKRSVRRRWGAAFVVVCALWTFQGRAVEGGLGRSITGLQVTDYAGVVPAGSGFATSLAYVYYSGRISASRQIPLSGNALLGLHAKFDLFSASAAYVWPTGEGRWNFMSLASVPFANIDISASISAGSRQGRVSDSVEGGLYDMSIVPIVASYHFDATHHLALALYISAPTGSYNAGRLANPSLNVWVYSPTVSFTRLGDDGTIDWSTSAGFDVSTWNHATNYRSGTVFHLDTQVVKHFASGWSAGVTGGWIDQVSDDSGALARRLNGFQGHSLAAGATVGYARKLKDADVSLSFRWLHEFAVKRRLEGDPLMLSGTIRF